MKDNVLSTTLLQTNHLTPSLFVSQGDGSYVSSLFFRSKSEADPVASILAC
jgi:hypothetical protein